MLYAIANGTLLPQTPEILYLDVWGEKSTLFPFKILKMLQLIQFTTNSRLLCTQV